MEQEIQIESLIKEAEIYGKQGLFKESQDKYNEILDLIKGSQETPNRQFYIDSVRDKLRTVEEKIQEVESASDNPELSEEVQDLISNLFSFSRTKEVAAIEGAVALAKFGQYEKAIATFQKLINQGYLPLVAAKNMLRCHLNLSSAETAVAQMNRWISRNAFSRGELRYLKDFLENLLQNEGIESGIASIEEGSDPGEHGDKRIEDIFEISSIRIQLGGTGAGARIMDLDVTFQLGSDISFVVNSNEKKIMELFKPGTRLSDIQCYSPVSLFNANGLISKREKIQSGPKKGWYNFDLTIKPKEPVSC